MARAVLAVVQIALAVVLLASGGLLMRTVVEILGEETGVEATGALSAVWQFGRHSERPRNG